MSDPYAMNLAASAAHVGISQDVIRAHCNSGDLPAKKNGTKWVIRREDLERWFDNLPTATAERAS